MGKVNNGKVISGVHCVAKNCGSSMAHLQEWEESNCAFHSGETHKQCGCSPPYQFFRLPRRSKIIRRRLLKRLKRSRDMKITEDTRVCSRHFPDGRINYKCLIENKYDLIMDEGSDETSDDESSGGDKSSLDSDDDEKEDSKLADCKSKGSRKPSPERSPSSSEWSCESSPESARQEASSSWQGTGRLTPPSSPQGSLPWEEASPPSSPGRSSPLPGSSTAP